MAHFVILPKFQEDEPKFRQALGNLCRSPSVEKHVRIVLAMEGLEGPNTQDKAERFMVVPRQLFEDTNATYHPLGILDRRLANHPAPVGFPAALEEIRCGLQTSATSAVFAECDIREVLFAPQIIVIRVKTPFVCDTVW